ncbi:hypothetical protein GCM10011519_12390 [Marmoricola endophyticus]|uniref:DUF6752 domain-containing protein n=2 Tax=Marmoricola endophyticus TaxID=2040280 RepID=A0A917BEH8_9ACTN|nr:hypothetical protein GCM10011519_12390 [Marmoricola endophyticus]
MSGMEQSFARRAARRVLRRESDLAARVAELEREVQELRRTNLRLAELTDVVEELLVPVASQDRAKIEAALERYPRSI